MIATSASRRLRFERIGRLGASERQVLWTVIVPAVLPNVVVAMRQMLAVSWTYLVIAEIVASTTGIGAMMMSGVTKDRNHPTTRT